ncbi:FAD dependent oxidoreductase [Bacteriovorax sp. BAL6_X]|uniref:FAD-dependent oxidoreductase n=1 Tax=Bacteriovorax sp. BAL6_X TaxID=1201290 RepID=UPI00038568E7|nr:FAD-dependent oxidoreductase [Bacteriovorax sp. BAL6_X]EPZ51301.1 FAD dependent oxidoreductase [Bacteriovorax sp. BAL6_X]
MKKYYDYIVVGDGIAGRAILYFLTKKYPNAKIAQVFDDEGFPACSTRTTSVVSFGLFEEGISKLGDILFHAHEFLKNFVEKEQPPGVYSCKQYYLPPNIKDDPLKFKQFEARYGTDFVNFKNQKMVAKDAYVINPRELLGFFKSDVKIIKARVTAVNKGEVQTSLGHFEATKIILATSAYTSLIFKDKNLPEGKPVKGTYFSWDIDLNEDSFVLSRGHYNLIYRAQDNLLLFGANSIEGLSHLHSPKEVYEKLEIFQDLFPEFSKLDKPNIHTGIRHKGKRRTPFCGEVREGIYALNALYKNGWSAGISLAKDLVDRL